MSYLHQIKVERRVEYRKLPQQDYLSDTVKEWFGAIKYGPVL
jgi:hypothetical protein